MPTLLNLKEFVADYIGTGDATTSVPKRDRLINAARREFYNEREWSFLLKSATLSFTNQIASLPSDYNTKFDPKIYIYQGNAKLQFRKVYWDDLLEHSGDYCFSIDKANKQIKISTTDSTATIDYTYMPEDKATDGSDNTDVEPAPDITPIGLLSIAMWWLSSQRATGKYQLFKDEYKTELSKAITQDPKPIRYFKRPSRDDFGYRGRR